MHRTEIGLRPKRFFLIAEKPNTEKNSAHDEKSRHQRAKVFSEWVIDKLSLETLKSGTLLDIAGGRGDLAFELALNFDLKCIVVDPRNVTQKVRRKYQRSKLKKLKKSGSNLFENYPEKFDFEFFQTYPHLKTETCLVLGLHPDQATEVLVDLCLKFSLKFAVIPCCVFAFENPERKLKNGDAPNTYELFCDYLMEKSPEIRCESLNFHGRNKVLFNF